MTRVLNNDIFWSKLAIHIVGHGNYFDKYQIPPNQCKCCMHGNDSGSKMSISSSFVSSGVLNTWIYKSECIDE